jgi:hypothetical protein
MLNTFRILIVLLFASVGGSNVQSYPHVGSAVSSPHIAFTALAGGTVGGAALAGSGTYSGVTPTSIVTATWNGCGGGASTPSGVSFSGGVMTASFTTPPSAGTGCTISIQTNLGSVAVSPGVTITSGGYVGPVDAAVGTANTSDECYSFYACSTAIAAAGTQTMFTLQKSAASNTCDFKAISSGGYGTSTNCSTGGDNGSSLATFISGGACVSDLYPQLGNGVAHTNHQAAGCSGGQPTFSLTAGPASGQPTMTGNNTQFLTGAALGTAQDYVVSAVAIRTGGFSTQAGMWACSAAPFSQITYAGVPNNVLIFSGGPTPTNISATDSAWHSFNGFYADTNSSLQVDGINSSTFPAGNAALGTSNCYMFGSGTSGSALQGALSELLFLEDHSTVRVNVNGLEANQHARFGF